MTSCLLLSLALITFFNRYAFFSTMVRYTPGPGVRKFLSYSSFAVLTAIWAPLVFNFSPTEGVGTAGLDYLLATLLAAVLTITRVRSILVVLLSTACFFSLRFWFF